MKEGDYPGRKNCDRKPAGQRSKMWFRAIKETQLRPFLGKIQASIRNEDGLTQPLGCPSNVNGFRERFRSGGVAPLAESLVKSIDKRNEML